MQARYYNPVIGRFYSNDPLDSIGHLSKRDLHGFNRYAYANNNPYKYIDPDGEDSFLVCRRITKGVYHNFIVTHANAPGQGGIVHTFGALENRTMGVVKGVLRGSSTTTWATDKKKWESLQGGSVDHVYYRKKNASDDDVLFLVKSVDESKDYGYVPGLTGQSVNSNSAAGAVAHAANGDATSVEESGFQFGHSQASRVRVGLEENEIITKGISLR
jgi:uncharacterized protein RhaS with RHS repeats